MIRAKSSGSRDAPPTRAPSISRLGHELGDVARASRCRRTGSACSSATSPSSSRSVGPDRRRIVSSASSGVALRPVPIAQIGSYATTHRSASAALIAVERGARSGPTPWRRSRRPRAPRASRPRTRSASCPCFEHGCTFRFTVSSVSPKSWRRSECPTITYLTLSFASIGGLTSPVNAPSVSQ